MQIGVVLGAGGSVGLAFHGGVLAALEEATGWDPRTASVLVGTSAGSLSAALLRSGMSASDLRALSEGRPLSDDATVFGGLGQPHRPRVHLADFLAPRRPGDTVGFLRGLCTPWRHPLATVCAALPEGPVSNEAISAGIDEAVGGRWPEAALWVCAVRLGDGAPAVFGRPGAPAAGLGAAVAASCAIPGYYRPVSIGGKRYVDGGVRSVHNADLLRDHADDLDLVVVSAPMAYAGRRPPMVADLALRQAVRVQLDWEVAALRRRGVEVVVVAPDRRMLTAMGVDAMDARRRGGVSRQARRMTLTQLASGDVATRVALAARTRRHRRPAA